MIYFQVQTFFKGALLATLLAAATVMASDSNRAIIKSARAMEREQGLTITTLFEMSRSIRRTQQIPDSYTLLGPSICPDGTALAWSSYPIPGSSEKSPFLTITSLSEGTQPIWVDGRVAVGSGLSYRAEVVVAIGIQLNVRQARHRELLAIDRRRGGAVYDLTRSVTQFELGNNLEIISVSGPGSLVALGEREREQIQVLEIPSGKTVYVGSGRFPRLSPDGTCLAFVNRENIWIHSFADGSTKQLLKVEGVKGLGGWSPDGRFLLAGAWTKAFAPEKRQIIVDTVAGEHAVIGPLAEGQYGNQFAWVSVKLLGLRPQNR